MIYRDIVSYLVGVLVWFVRILLDKEYCVLDLLLVGGRERDFICCFFFVFCLKLIIICFIGELILVVV